MAETHNIGIQLKIFMLTLNGKKPFVLRGLYKYISAL